MCSLVSRCVPSFPTVVLSCLRWACVSPTLFSQQDAFFQKVVDGLSEVLAEALRASEVSDTGLQAALPELLPERSRARGT